MIIELMPSQASELENFLVLVFGEKFRNMAKEHIAEMFSASLCRPIFLVRCDGKQIVSAAAVSKTLFTVHTWGIGWVGVHPDLRHQGLGQEIVQAALDAIGSRVTQTSTAILSAYPDISVFYKNIGFSGSTTDHEGSPFLTRSVIPKPIKPVNTSV